MKAGRSQGPWTPIRHAIAIRAPTRSKGTTKGIPSAWALTLAGPSVSRKRPSRMMGMRRRASPMATSSSQTSEPRPPRTRELSLRDRIGPVESEQIVEVDPHVRLVAGRRRVAAGCVRCSGSAEPSAHQRRRHGADPRPHSDPHAPRSVSFNVPHGACLAASSSPLPHPSGSRKGRAAIAPWRPA